MHANIAERIAYGTPLDPVADETPFHVVPRSGTVLIGRLLLAAIFLVSGFAKLVDVEGTAGYMTAVGIPAAHTLTVVAGVAEILGALAIAIGLLARIGALGLILYLIPTTLIFHGFWAYEGSEQKLQLVNFMKNLGIVGGLMLVFAYGAGRYSVDAKLRKPLQA